MAKNGDSTGWKVATIVLAIVSFILLVALIIETVAFIAVYAYGNALIEMEDECASEICSLDKNYTSYDFDDESETCYCYVGQEIVLEKQIEWSD